MATLSLERHMDRVGRRIRVLRALRWAVLFALAGASLSTAFAVAVWVRRISFPVPEGLLFLAGCSLAGALAGYLRRVTRFQVALATDARLGLQERLSSALDLCANASEDPAVGALVEDATRRAEGIDPKAAYPLRAPRETRALVAALLFLVLAVVLPALPILQSPQQRAEKAAMRAEGERIVRIAREMRKANKAKNADVQRQIAHNLEKLGKAMRSSRVSKKQALVKMHALTKEMAEAQKRLEAEAAPKSLAQASKELAKDTQTESGDAARRVRKMADALARNDTETAARILEEMAKRAASGKMSAQEMQQIAREAEKIAGALSGTQLQQAAKQLQEAAKQMRQGQMASASKQMQQAGGT